MWQYCIFQIKKCENSIEQKHIVGYGYIVPTFPTPHKSFKGGFCITQGTLSVFILLPIHFFNNLFYLKLRVCKIYESMNVLTSC